MKFRNASGFKSIHIDHLELGSPRNERELTLARFATVGENVRFSSSSSSFSKRRFERRSLVRFRDYAPAMQIHAGGLAFLRSRLNKLASCSCSLWFSVLFVHFVHHHESTADRTHNGRGMPIGLGAATDSDFISRWENHRGAHETNARDASGTVNGKRTEKFNQLHDALLRHACAYLTNGNLDYSRNRRKVKPQTPRCCFSPISFLSAFDLLFSSSVFHTP